MPMVNSIHLEDYRIGGWKLFIGNMSRFVSNELKTSLGYAMDAFDDAVVSWKQLVTHEDIFAVYRTYVLHVCSHGQLPLIQQVRLKHKTGRLINFIFTGETLEWDEKGVPIKLSGFFMNMTHQLETERELLKIKYLLERTTREALIGGWELDLVTQKTAWTLSANKILELPENGVPGSDLATGYFKHEIDKKVFRQTLTNAIKNGISVDLEQALISVKGNEIWTRLVIQPEFEDGACTRVTTLFKDITSQKKQEAALRHNKELLTTIISHAPGGIAMLDRELRYITMSNTWVRSYKLEGRNIIGEKHYDIFPEIPARWKKIYQRCLNGETIKSNEDSFVRANGSTEWLEWEVTPWYENKGEIGGIIIFSNLLTGLRLAEQELDKSKKEVEGVMLAKSKFLSMISHELRTPMNAVLGFVNLLLENPRKDQVEKLSILKSSANDLLMLIDDLLDFNFIDKGKVVLEELDLNIVTLFNNLLIIHLPEANVKRLSINCIVDSKIPTWVKTDGIRLSQVFNNLIGNAIKFTPAGSVTFTATLMEETKETVTVSFEVNDTGPGISKDQQELIFEMFWQANLENTRAHGGTGIGLAISRRLLELMGSQIQVKSKVGSGSSFSFLLKMKKNSEFLERDTTLVTTRYEALRGIKILIVEDNSINALITKEFLKKWEADFDLAENGKQGVVKVQEKKYDIILMDLQMPEMDGYAATTTIRKLPGKKYKQIPIIALTASADADMLDKISLAGMNGYVRKPFKPDELYGVLVAYTSNQRK